jgi:ABC-2 type transport system permease protein/sodium transport system permease protein
MPIPRSADSFGFRLARLARLARKELTEILRDRRTIFTLVLMPLLLYPLLVIAFQTFSRSEATPERKQYHFAFYSDKDRDFLRIYLYTGQQARLQHVPPPAGRAPSEPDLLGEVFADPEAEVRAGKVHVAFRPREESVNPNQPVSPPRDWDLLYREDWAEAREAVAYVEYLYAAAHGSFLDEHLKMVAPRRLVPLRVTAVPLSSGDGAGGSLTVFVPLVLILMTITGAVYPAIDLTAGERERGTLEILISAPIPRVSVLFAKYVAVLAVAVLTAVVNLTAMTVSLMISGYGEKVFGPGGPALLTLLEVFGLVLLFAAFFSAVLLVVTSFARSFKEAQAYLIPLMLVSLAPGVAALVSGLSLDGPLAVVPLLNIVLLGRDLLDGTVRPAGAAVAVASTAVYAVLAVVVAARLFGGEAVLYSETGLWHRLFRRRKLRGRPEGG